jgi:hypothetical protein
MSDNDEDRHELVRRRAYLLWEEAGRPEGRNEEFWHQAKSEMLFHGEGDVENQETFEPDSL